MFMMKKIIISVFCICLIFGFSFPAEASVSADTVEAMRSNAVITVNGVRMPLRAYDIEGRLFVDVFEIAIALSGTENQFAVRWGDRNRALYISNGRPFTAIGLMASGRAASIRPATPVEISIFIDGEAIQASAFNILSETYIEMRAISTNLDFFVDWDPEKNILAIDTSLPHYEPPVPGRRIDPDKPMVALTFDDGPSRFTVPIVEALEEYEAVATFYVTGNRVESNSELVLRTFNTGSEFANHSWSHPRLDNLTDERIRRELQNTNDAIEAITGVAPNNMRPPYGGHNKRVRDISAELGLSVIIWSLDPMDWLHRDSNYIYNRVMNNVKDRDIILLHDLYETTANAAVRLIPALLDRGYQLVTVSELFYYSGVEAIPGHVYRDGTGN